MSDQPRTESGRSGEAPSGRAGERSRDDRPQRSAYPVQRPVPTRWEDEDVYGHVNNVAYYSYVDTAVNGWLIETTGTDIRRLPAIGIVVESGCRYHAAITFPQPVTVGIALERLGRSSVAYRLGIFAGDSETPAATATFVHVYVDADSRRPVEIPPAIRAVLVGHLATTP